MLIKNIVAREILDSRGIPTIEVVTILKNGVTGRFSVPSGSNIGCREAVKKRDINNRYFNKGVKKVIESINNDLKYELIGIDSKNQKKIDNILIKKDGTRNKRKYGANAILAISFSVLKAEARNNGLPLYKYLGGNLIPRIIVNIINGGNNLSIKEFMIVPIVKTVKEQVRYSSEVFQTLKVILKEKGLLTSVCDEGGFESMLDNTESSLNIIIEAGYKLGKDIYIALNCSANKFYDGKKYTTVELIKFYKRIINKYPIISIEDPFYENDTKGYIKFNDDLGKHLQIVGDNLFVTNKEQLKKGIKDNLANAIIIKPNQIGTYTEMMKTIKYAVNNGIKPIISSRSGETEDTTIADIAVGLNLGQIKCSSMS